MLKLDIICPHCGRDIELSEEEYNVLMSLGYYSGECEYCMELYRTKIYTVNRRLRDVD